MNKLILPVLILLPTLTGVAVDAADFPGRMATMGNLDLDIDDSMNGRCSSDDGGETLNCIFTTVSIDHKVPPGEADQAVEAFFDQAAQRGNVEESIANLFSRDGLCGGSFLERLDRSGSGKTEDFESRLAEMCAANPGEDSARELLGLEAEVGSRTCLVWATSGETGFKRVAPGRWSLQTEPSGACQVYDIYELACEQDMYHCRYDEHAEYLVTEGEFCEGFQGVVDQGDHYSWEVARTMDLDCDFVQFWFE